jgi:hypothetical protein
MSLAFSGAVPSKLTSPGSPVLSIAQPSMSAPNATLDTPLSMEDVSNKTALLVNTKDTANVSPIPSDVTLSMNSPNAPSAPLDSPSLMEPAPEPHSPAPAEHSSTKPPSPVIKLMTNAKNGLLILEPAHLAKTHSKKQSLESALPLNQHAQINNSSMHFLNVSTLIHFAKHSRSSVENASSAFGDLITTPLKQNALRLFAKKDLCQMILEDV